jgi:hypothetical protein
VTGIKITPQPEYDALYAFDAENNVEPFRTIAERIGLSYGFAEQHPLVDVIAAAIEDAHDLGVRRGPLIPPCRT